MIKLKGRFLTRVLIIMLLPGCGGDSFNLFSPEEDAELGKQFAESVYADPEQFPVLDSIQYGEAYQHVRKITEKILASEHVTHRNDFLWRVHIVDNDSVLNAFCTPGGYIFVYTGLIRHLQSEDQLAGVIGHEIAHADLRHSTEQLTKSMGVQLLTRLIAGDAATLGNLANHLLQLGFSRKDETEADLQSVNYLYDTDYDARGVARFFERMEHNSGDLQFLNTHPDPVNRVEKIIAHWNSLGGKTGKTFEAEYKNLIKKLPAPGSK